MTNELEENDMLAWALRYAALGWKIFPLRTAGDLKRPHVCVPNGHLGASNDPEQVTEWWSAYPTAGIGLYLSDSNLIAVDVDPRSGGFADLEALKVIHGPLRTPTVAKTGGGGLHYLYGAPVPVKPPGKLAGKNGIDLKYNGYIVLAPSPHNSGDNYSWLPGKSPFEGRNSKPMLGHPKWFLNRPELPATVQRGTVDSDPDLVGSDKAGITLGQLAELLTYLPNDDVINKFEYPEWFDLCAGIWHEFDGSPEAAQIVLEWCEQSPRHLIEEFEKKWPSMDHRGKDTRPITIRKLIKLATAAKKAMAGAEVREIKAEIGAANSVEQFRAVSERIKTTEMEQFDRDLLVPMMQEVYKRATGSRLILSKARSYVAFMDIKATDTPDWLDDYVYISGDDLFFKRGTLATMSKNAFDNNFNHWMLNRKERLEGATRPEHTASDAALNRFEIPRVDLRMYLPGDDSFFTFNNLTCVNTYSAKSVPAVPNPLTAADLAAQEIILAHFRHITKTQRDADIFMSWLALLVQTGKRPNWSVVVQSLEGDGKSFFTKAGGCVLGASNVRVLNPSVLKGDFTGWAEGHQLKVIEEIKLHGAERFDVLDKLKEYITNDVVSIHAKGKDPYTAMNTASYLAVTNHRDALPVQAGDTRYYLIASPFPTPESVAQFKAANPDYYKRLFDVLDQHPGAVRGLFETYPIHPECSLFSRAPRSDEKDYVTRLNKSEARQDIETLLEESSDPALCAKLFDTTLMQDKLEEAGDDVPQTSSIKAAMVQLGFQYLGRFKINGANRRYWSQVPHMFGLLGEKSTSEAIRTYLLANSVDDL